MAGKVGRPKLTEAEMGKVLLRLPKTLLAQIEHCQWLLQRQRGPKVTRNTALLDILKAGCEALERQLEAGETPVAAYTTISKLSDMSPRTVAKISEISGDDVNVPGYGFPEDEDERPEPLPAPASHVNGQGAAPAPAAVKKAPTTHPQNPMHQRILTLLEGHPEGLDESLIRMSLKVRTSLGRTLGAMVRRGLLERQAHGWHVRYVAATPAQPIPEMSHDDNTVLQESAEQITIPPYDEEEIPALARHPNGQGAPAPGAPAPVKTAPITRSKSTMRQRILKLLEKHPDGLEETHIMGQLRAGKQLGSILRGMVRGHLLERQGSGYTARYWIATAPTVTPTTP